MTDRHGRDKLTFRPPPEIRQVAQAALAAHNDDHPDDRWSMNDVLSACLAALTNDPGGLLGLLAGHRPPPPKKGRPKLRP